MKLAIASDHGGYKLKEALKADLMSAGFDVADEGCFSEESVDYPNYAEKVGRAVASGKADFGVLICTSGIGMCIAANKVRGVRAAYLFNEDGAKFSRLHNNANVMCLGAKYISADLASKIARIFLSTDFEGGRHARRVGEISALEGCSAGVDNLK